MYSVHTIKQTLTLYLQLHSNCIFGFHACRLPDACTYTVYYSYCNEHEYPYMHIVHDFTSSTVKTLLFILDVQYYFRFIPSAMNVHGVLLKHGVTCKVQHLCEWNVPQTRPSYCDEQMRRAFALKLYTFYSIFWQYTSLSVFH